MTTTDYDHRPMAHPIELTVSVETRTRWRRVKTLGQHQVGVNLQSHAQHQL